MHLIQKVSWYTNNIKLKGQSQLKLVNYYFNNNNSVFFIDILNILLNAFSIEVQILY